jgi:iron complex outermembrane receptor protein
LKTVASALAISAALMATAAAQTGDDAIVVTGVRSDQRTVLTSPVPVDVFSGDALAETGAVGNELGQALATLAPSFNFPRQSNSGTSDHIRAGQLRGLSPDQTLVLVNGHRRHQSAVVNSETKIGRGAAAVDFNTIPLGAVGRVEVLRDGAGAQYGSDAIAGVVNIILDDAPEGV